MPVVLRETFADPPDLRVVCPYCCGLVGPLVGELRDGTVGFLCPQCKAAVRITVDIRYRDDDEWT